MKECTCDLRTRVVGDGCEICNPEKALEYAKETIAYLERELAAYKQVTSELVAKWKRQTEGNYGDRANAMARCADELEAAILAANAQVKRTAEGGSA